MLLARLSVAETLVLAGTAGVGRMAPSTSTNISAKLGQNLFGTRFTREYVHTHPDTAQVDKVEASAEDIRGAVRTHQVRRTLSTAGMPVRAALMRETVWFIAGSP